MASDLLFPIKKPEFYFIENSGFFAMSYELFLLPSLIAFWPPSLLLWAISYELLAFSLDLKNLCKSDFIYEL